MKKHVCDFKTNGTMANAPKGTYYQFDKEMVAMQYKLQKLDMVEMESAHDNMLWEELELHRFLKGEGIDFGISDQIPCAMFSVTNSGYALIAMDEESFSNGSVYRTMAIAHELGHYMDLKHNHDLDNKKFSKNADGHSNLLACETTAWKYAVDILKEMGFAYGFELEALIYDSLYTYTGNHYLTVYLMEHMEEIANAREEGGKFLEWAKIPVICSGRKVD